MPGTRSSIAEDVASPENGNDSSSLVAANEIKLAYHTSELISSVRFSSTNQYLLISAWDSRVALLDISANRIVGSYDHEGFPVLDSCFQDKAHSFSGGLDGKVRMNDFFTGIQTVIGFHDQPIRVTEYVKEKGVLLTGSWDSSVRIWDPRMSRCVHRLPQPDRVYAMALIGEGERFIVGTAGRKLAVWDMRHTEYILQRRESTLKYQTRCIKVFPDELGFALSSIEGRIAFEYLDSSPEVQEKKYAFKCHRIRENGLEKIYPVNALSFHPKFCTFASGGSDGFINIWDGFNKKRLCQFHKYPLPVTSANFSHDGHRLAIACSPLYTEDDCDDPSDNAPDSSIYLRYVTQAEVRPKRNAYQWRC